MKTAIVVLVLLVLSAGGLYLYAQHYAADPPSNFRTATVKRGELLATISATGTAEPEEVVDVGAQIAGLVKTLGQDPTDPTKSIDWGSVVQPGTVLARIDDSLYKAQLDQAQATLKRAEADLGQMKAKLAQAAADLSRAKVLIKTRAIADSDYDAAVANYGVAAANVDVDVAAIAQAKAELNLAQTNMGYTVIQSPVKGVIIDRRVNVGQTVVAALNAPSMFLIAKDLRRLQIWASVNEADIGRIKQGMAVHFTVDTFPGETFYGKVAQVRLNATMTQNVVTYTVAIDTDNSNLKLLPYLTANVQFEVQQYKDVLLVPNAALRWKPTKQQIVPDMRDSVDSGMPGRKDGRKKEEAKDKADTSPGAQSAEAKPAEGKPAGGKPADDKSGKPIKDRDDRGRIWVQEGNLVRPVSVRILATDGTTTAIGGKQIEQDVEKGDVDVVIGENTAADQTNDTNPFLPKLFCNMR